MKFSNQGRRAIISGVPEGFDARVVSDMARAATRDGGPGLHIHVTRDDRRLDALETGIAFFAPDLRVITLPAWDSVPYDRVSPNAEIVSKRITALGKLVIGSLKEPTVVLTTVNAILQRLPPRTFIRGAFKPIAPGQRVDMGQLVKRLSLYGFQRASTVMEPGEFAVRGGILDLFPPGRINPLRLDFFGDNLESIKSFDPQTQRSTKPVQKFALMPVSEVAFGESATALFRTRYVELFGGSLGDDPLYEAVSTGRRYQGQEHWLPLFHPTLETLFDYCEGASISFDHMADQAVEQRFAQITEHYEARVDSLEGQRFGAPPYKPVPPDRMFLDGATWSGALHARAVTRLTPFDDPELHAVMAMNGRKGRTFAAERANPDANVFDAVVEHIRMAHTGQRRVMVAAWTAGARERLMSLLADHGLRDMAKVETFTDVLALKGGVTALAVLGLEEGFETPDVVVVAEQDILGDRLVRQRKRVRKAADVLTEATSLSVGDLVVHADHGIGRFSGLQTITALGAPHDCLELVYAGGDKLFLPVENIELLTRYGDAEGDGQLDKLGGLAWQSRKAKLKKRLREIANELIKIAALRQLKEATPIQPPHGAYDEFVARFPYDETEDQAASIDAVIEDLGSGRPMDRLICGDVGFGKTEVAMRAAFVAALNGLQVAVVVPTTLLARQHFRTFSERFKGLPVRVGQASRMVTPKDLAEVKDGLKSGQIDIVVGTHALLGKQIEFARLGLIIVDEEQHFGVNHKERLKKLRE
ncbi:MAG: DEAD/DEAH box helicase, partial [Hyphomicrobium sp.]